MQSIHTYDSCLKGNFLDALLSYNSFIFVLDDVVFCNIVTMYLINTKCNNDQHYIFTMYFKFFCITILKEFA